MRHRQNLFGHRHLVYHVDNRQGVLLACRVEYLIQIFAAGQLHRVNQFAILALATLPTCHRGNPLCSCLLCRHFEITILLRHLTCGVVGRTVLSVFRQDLNPTSRRGLQQCGREVPVVLVKIEQTTRALIISVLALADLPAIALRRLHLVVFVHSFLLQQTATLRAK